MEQLEDVQPAFSEGSEVRLPPLAPINYLTIELSWITPHGGRGMCCPRDRHLHFRRSWKRVYPNHDLLDVADEDGSH